MRAKRRHEATYLGGEEHWSSSLRHRRTPTSPPGRGGRGGVMRERG
eukprot:SAG31_NODE_48496_length_184_cov_65.117647_1_plen_45_part_10